MNTSDSGVEIGASHHRPWAAGRRDRRVAFGHLLPRPCRCRCLRRIEGDVGDRVLGGAAHGAARRCRAVPSSGVMTRDSTSLGSHAPAPFSLIFTRRRNVRMYRVGRGGTPGRRRPARAGAAPAPAGAADFGQLRASPRHSRRRRRGSIAFNAQRSCAATSTPGAVHRRQHHRRRHRRRAGSRWGRSELGRQIAPKRRHRPRAAARCVASRSRPPVQAGVCLQAFARRDGRMARRSARACAGAGWRVRSAPIATRVTRPPSANASGPGPNGCDERRTRRARSRRGSATSASCCAARLWPAATERPNTRPLIGANSSISPRPATRVRPGEGLAGARGRPARHAPMPGSVRCARPR